MTGFWLLVAAGCALAAASGFSLVRYAVPSLPKFRAVDPGSIPAWRVLPGTAQPPEPVAAAVVAVREPPVAPVVEEPPELPVPPVPAPAAVPRRAEAPARRRAAAARMPAPTAPEPDAAKLALWARQVKAGERKLSVATDGCRVTWDRTCKHGHPSWLVRLGYLQRPRPKVARHTPR
ncbi:MAG TPA: hypothetical protein VGK92_05960 [Gaiellales bacterium]